MAGRKPLDPTLKAERRRATLRRYAEKWMTNKDALREAARLRMQRLRAIAAEDAEMRASRKQRDAEAAARYRHRNRQAIRETDTLRRARKYIANSGLEAFDEKTERKTMARTQHRHEGRPPVARARPPVARSRAPSAPLRKRPVFQHSRRHRSAPAQDTAAPPPPRPSSLSAPSAEPEPEDLPPWSRPRPGLRLGSGGLFDVPPLSQLKRPRPPTPETPSPRQQTQRPRLDSPLPASSDDDSSSSDF
ncbi:hypothetical protein DFH06DRAFT_1124058 [Mycena polygramma]|nr:hypothetical protein DFH06DRAFT_1124058 [Mycena polygramma]